MPETQERIVSKMPDKQVPAYRRIKDDIIRQIVDREISVGQSLLSERELGIKYGLSRTTVRHALNELEMQGYLYRLQGKGTFVSNHKMEQALIGITGFSDDMQRRNKIPESRVLSMGVCAADKVTANALKLQLGASVVKLERLRIADHVPMAVEHAYLNFDLTKGILGYDLSNRSLYQILRTEFHLQFRNGSQYLEATQTDLEHSRLLGVPVGSVALSLERHISIMDGTPLEVVYSIYRGDLFRFYIELEGSK